VINEKVLASTGSELRNRLLIDPTSAKNTAKYEGGVLVQRSFRALLFSAPNFRRPQFTGQECAQKSVD
jgi:hypothetical protein